MKTYFSNLIPQILSHSKKLDSSSILTNHHWTVVDESLTEKTVFIFRPKENQLLISRNGKVEKGTWELIDHNTLLIDTKTESRMFKHGFADDSVLALKVDGKTEYAFLVDENMVPAYAKNIEGIARFLEKKYINKVDQNISENKIGSNENIPNADAPNTLIFIGLAVSLLIFLYLLLSTITLK